MPHRRQPMLASVYFEQRRTKDANATDESKRRKVIQWIKKTVGVRERRSSDIRRETDSTEPPPARKYSQDSTGSSSERMTDTPEFGGVMLYDADDIPHHVNRFATSNPIYISRTATRSASSIGSPSIYEYHHRMPPHRIPRLPSNEPHVLILGGGIGGLCLAQGLKKNGIPFTIFERDPAPNYRTQGYRLRINSSGYEALKANLSPENFEVFLQSTGYFLPGFKYVDAETGGPAPDGVKFAHRSSVTQHVFSTDRAMLRSLMLADLREGSEIQYGMAFKKYEILANGRVEVQFENGRRAQGSIVVGADGTTSRVRRQYIPHHITLLDTHSGAIYGKTPITPEIEQYFATGCTTMVTSQNPQMSVVIEPRCATKANLKKYIAATGGLANAANQELPELPNYLCWVLLARANEFHVRDNMTVHDLYSMAPHEVAELSIQLTENWCPRVRRLFEMQDPEWASFLRISTMSPEIKTWQPTCITLLGDAAHTMAPAGIGSNTAMYDAKILVKAFKEFGVNVDAIAQYERTMREHGREGIAISMDAGKRMYGLPDYREMQPVVY